jgi:hypothetical protein
MRIEKILLLLGIIAIVLTGLVIHDGCVVFVGTQPGGTLCLYLLYHPTVALPPSFWINARRSSTKKHSEDSKQEDDQLLHDESAAGD